MPSPSLSIHGNITPLADDELQTVRGGGFVALATVIYLAKVLPWAIKIGASGFVSIYSGGKWVVNKIRG
jgi:hypothetical protein